MDDDNKPWSMPMLIIAIVASLGTGVYNAKPKLYEFKSGLWFFTFAALILTIIWYGNAIYCYKEKSRAFNDYKTNKDNGEQFKNISDRVGMLESRFDNFVKEGGIKPHS